MSNDRDRLLLAYGAIKVAYDATCTAGVTLLNTRDPEVEDMYNKASQILAALRVMDRGAVVINISPLAFALVVTCVAYFVHACTRGVRS